MEAGDADVEAVVAALDEGERVVAVAAVEVVVVALDDDDRVVAASSLRVALRQRRATDVSDAGRSRRLGCSCP